MRSSLILTPASFQRMINAALPGLKGMNLQVFIDDVCISTHTWPEHLALLERVIQAILKGNLKLKPSKCIFGASKVTFLGHEISRDGINQEPSKLSAL